MSGSVTEIFPVWAGGCSPLRWSVSSGSGDGCLCSRVGARHSDPWSRRQEPVSCEAPEGADQVTV